MKTREGFVSNSSNCSFVVKFNEIVPNKNFAEVIKDLADYVPYTCEGDIRVYFWLKDNLQFFNILKTPVPVNFKLEDFNISSEMDYFTDNKLVFCMSLNTLFGDAEMWFGDYNPDWSKVEKIKFDCDDFEQLNVMILYCLKAYLEKKGFECDTSDSERDLNDGDKGSITSFIVKTVGEK
jgi:hypothetical protein